MKSELQSGRRVRALGPQGRVGVVSPASCVEGFALDAGCRALADLSGWQVATSSSVLQREGGFAGSPAARAGALLAMWQRDDVDAVICARGGYGSNYLLPLLDFDALQMTPKAFVGYSDNTCLLLALDSAGIVSFHGPMVASDFARGAADEYSFRAALGGKALDFSFAAGANHGGEDVQVLVAGEARGPMVGGCLSVVVTSLGTPWEIETAGKILFLEDVNEKPYRIDRMLRHLLLAGKFRGVRGVVFGAMLGCSAASESEEELPRMILRVLGELGVPVVLGFPSGHVESGNVTLPFGVPAALEGSAAGVRLQVEPATFFAIQNSHP
jgi:muramoyltetrapeptide carboxypeptidase